MKKPKRKTINRRPASRGLSRTRAKRNVRPAPNKQRVQSPKRAPRSKSRKLARGPAAHKKRARLQHRLAGRAKTVARKKRQPAKAKTRKPAPRRTRKQTRKQAGLARENRKLQKKVRELQGRLEEATRQPPSPFPTARDFARAAARAEKERTQYLNSIAEALGDEEEDEVAAALPDFPTYREAALEYTRDEVEDAEEGEEWEESETYQDMLDYDWDDYDEDVGDEDEDSYGEDAK